MRSFNKLLDETHSDRIQAFSTFRFNNGNSQHVAQKRKDPDLEEKEDLVNILRWCRKCLGSKIAQWTLLSNCDKFKARCPPPSVFIIIMKQKLQGWVCHTFRPFYLVLPGHKALWLVERQGYVTGDVTLSLAGNVTLFWWHGQFHFWWYAGHFSYICRPSQLYIFRSSQPIGLLAFAYALIYSSFNFVYCFIRKLK